ncbi:MoCF biosynth [Geosmithia morbida]|uniref:MoCF biosynth n=1 Tax=Geosmithia morbida TaxID=1094350 RepID=A0A9P5D9J9_9HYPO|nr:MoCF biosynth [Geosmithia morbida]KAF4126604.1 MoCF biosynth [Geosmithia morbida]
MAKWCFSQGIVGSDRQSGAVWNTRLTESENQNFKRIEVIEDDESEIVEAARRMSERYDIVVTSPRHDDITYQSMAKAFNLPLKLHQETFEKMKKLSKARPNDPPFDWNDLESPTLKARLRMAELPTDESRDLRDQFIFPHDDLWVPVAVVNRNIHILPGIPIQRLLDGLRPHLASRLVDPEGKGTHRIMVSTPLPESTVAAYLTELAAKVEAEGVKVGSYPRWGKKSNTVTLVGRDLAFLESLVPDVEKNVKGRRIQTEGEDDSEEEKGTGA